MKRMLVRGAGIMSIALGLLVFASILSYRHAEAVADQFVGPLPPEMTRFRAAPIPFHRFPVSQRWSWVIAYGDRNRDGFEVYVSVAGHIAGTNPPVVQAQLEARRSAAGQVARPTP